MHYHPFEATLAIYVVQHIRYNALPPRFTRKCSCMFQLCVSDVRASQHVINSRFMGCSALRS